MRLNDNDEWRVDTVVDAGGRKVTLRDSKEGLEKTSQTGKARLSRVQSE